MNTSYIEAGILFFDVHGYSKLNEIQLQAFHEKVWPWLFDLIESEKSDYLYKNTWGDGIVLLHQDAEILADVALSLRDYFNHRKYTDVDVLYKLDLRSRIAIHKAEFLPVKDPFQNREGFFGLEIVRGARIEPIIPPGRVWATDELVKAIKDRQSRRGQLARFNFTLKGELPLAKAFGTEIIWEITHAGESSLPEEVVEMKTESGDQEPDTQFQKIPVDDIERYVHSRRIFIVHGHEDGLKNSVARLLEKLDFEPVILHEQSDQGRTIFQKLTDEMADVGYAFVLLTPDDIGASVSEIEKENFKSRARQNVIFEHGLFIGHLGPQRVCAICSGDIEIPSDLHGVLYKKIPSGGNISSIAVSIVKELNAVGYEVNANKLLE